MTGATIALRLQRAGGRFVAPGLFITAAKRAALEALARCGDAGSCHVHGVMDGAHLSYLVQCGLAERIPSDAIGGLRYRVTAAGRDFLGTERRAA